MEIIEKNSVEILHTFEEISQIMKDANPKFGDHSIARMSVFHNGQTQILRIELEKSSS